MSMFFDKLQDYATKWAFKNARGLTQEETASVNSAVVVPSQYGTSVCFHMKAGSQKFLPLSNDSTAKVGETIDLSKAELVTLSKPGADDILRVRVIN